MLAGFLDLPYNDFVLLLEEAGLFDTIPLLQASCICFNYDKMNMVKGGGENVACEKSQSNSTSKNFVFALKVQLMR